MDAYKSLDALRVLDNVLFYLFLLPSDLYDDWSFLNTLESALRHDKSLIEFYGMEFIYEIL